MWLMLRPTTQALATFLRTKQWAKLGQCMRKASNQNVARFGHLEMKIKKNTVLYYLDDKKHAYFILFFGWIQFISWGVISLSTDLIKKPENVPQAYLDKHVTARMIQKYDVYQYKYKLAAITLLLSVGSLVTSAFFLRRSVHSIVLLKNGTHVLIGTRFFYGGVNTSTVPLKNLSAVQARNSSGSYVKFKRRHHMFNFLVDQRGTFNEKLFDPVMMVKRQWA